MHVLWLNTEAYLKIKIKINTKCVIKNMHLHTWNAQYMIYIYINALKWNITL